MKLRDVRTERGLSQRELAERSGVSQEAIKAIEGEKSVPRGETRRLLAEALGVEVAAIRWPGQPPRRGSDEAEPTALWSPGGEQLPWVSGAGRFGPMVFAPDLPDLLPIEGMAHGVVLRFPFWLPDTAALPHILEAIARALGATGPGWFLIEQEARSWFGSGADQFVGALHGWRERYAEPRVGHLHGTEDALYAGLAGDVLYTLRLGVRPRGAGMVTQASFAALLPGIPLDQQRFQRVAQSLGVRSELFFLPLAKSPVALTRWFRRDGERLHPIAFLRDDRGQTSGVVAGNPFYRASGLIRVLRTRSSPVLGRLAANEFLPCALLLPHEAQDGPVTFTLRQLDALLLDEIVAVRAYADWRPHARREGRR